MSARLTWFGVSTFRLEVDDEVIFLDTFVDRAPSAPEVGLRSRDVERADFVLLGHSHFDHALGADTIALNTGATVVGSYETVRAMADEGVPEEQLLPVAGGEIVRVGERVRVRVFPSLHSCNWAPGSRDTSECLVGDTEVVLQDRLHRQAGAFRAREKSGPAHGLDRIPAVRGDGGPLAYLIETPECTIWWNDTSGYWSWVTRGLRPDVAILAASGRGNVDGEPIQGSLADYVGGQAELLQPRRVIFAHHDNWNPPRTREMDLGPVISAIRERGGDGARTYELNYNDPVRL